MIIKKKKIWCKCFIEFHCGLSVTENAKLSAVLVKAINFKQLKKKKKRNGDTITIHRLKVGENC